MKKILSILLFFCVIFSLTAQNNNAVKIKFYGGYVLPTNVYKNLGPNGPVLGGELNYEILPTGRYSWEKHWGYPTIGVGVLGVDLGNPSQLGMMLAAYPYINWNFVRTDVVEFGLKTGMGLAFFNKTNAANGGYVAAYLSAGINLQFNINNAAITVDAGYNATNNGEIFLPNSTMNIIYGSLGFRYRMGSAAYSRPRMSRADNLPYKFMINAVIDGGFRNDRKNKMPEVQSNIHGDILWKITNCYTLGPGVDLGFTPNGTRVGLTISNAFTMGRVMGIIDAGYYLYDKIAIKNNGGYKLWYKFDPNVVDGPLYLRAGLRVRLFDNIFVQFTGKTHLYRFDYIGIGVGYSIPYSTARGSRFGGRTSRYGFGNTRR